MCLGPYRSKVVRPPLLPAARRSIRHGYHGTGQGVTVGGRTMAKATDELFGAACKAYERYVGNLGEFVKSMADLGVQVKNVEPFANFAEVIAAHELGGEIQPPATKGYDLLKD